MAVKRVATAAEAKNKTEPKKAELKKTESIKEEKEAPAKKAEEKKAVPKKKAAVKKDIKINAIVEYQGKQVEEKTMIAAVKKAWTKTGNKVGDIKTMNLYIKPEENSVYYVINGSDTGKVGF